MRKPIAILAAFTLSAALGSSLYAQITTLAPASQQVQLLAPQLVPFAGSPANFDSLVSGLTQGTPVTLTSLSPEGFLQIVTFVPGAPMSAADAARNLEAARQNLIVRGIVAPTAQQLAVALMGGTLTTATGTTPLTGVLTGAAVTTPIVVRNELAPLSTLATAPALSLSAADLQALRTVLAQGTSVTLTSTTATGAIQNVTFTPPGGPMNAFEANQALQLATALLAQQGILTPTPDQIRVALVGGNLVNASGANIAVQGVLQGRMRATSESPFFGTSNTPLFGTSNTPPTVSPVVTPPPITSPTAPITNVDGVRRPNTAEGANRGTIRRGG